MNINEGNLSLIKSIYSFSFLNGKAVVELSFQGSGIGKDLNSCVVLLLLPFIHCPRQSSILPMLRCRCEVNFLRILSQTNLEISGFLAICILLDSMSLYILLFLKWKMTAENGAMLSPLRYMLVYETVLAFRCINISLIPYLDLFLCSEALRSHSVHFSKVFV